MGQTSTHDLTTWKVGGFWDITPQVRIRASQSHDSRAPNMRELYYRQVLPAGGFFGSVQNVFRPNTGFGSRTDTTLIELNGNVDVKPEVADTTTLGVVLRPTGFLEGLDFAADYFAIELEDGINQAFSTRETSACFFLEDGVTENTPEGAVTTPGCANILDSDGVPFNDPTANLQDVGRVISGAYNGGVYRTRGVDYSLGYTRQLGDQRSLSGRVIATQMIEQFYDSGSNLVVGDYTNQIGAFLFLNDYQPAPEWSGSFMLSYYDGPLTVSGQVRYVHDTLIVRNGYDPGDPPGEAGDIEPDPNNPLVDIRVPGTPGYNVLNNTSRSKNHLDPYANVNLSASYQLLGDRFGGGRSVQIWGNVDNVFDQSPPMTGGGFGGTSAGYYDIYGRAYRIGIRATF